MADIGWHLLDMVVGLVGASPDCPPSVLYFKLFHVRSHQGYDCEDSAEVILGFPSLSKDMTAHLILSTIGHKQIESVIITGDQGALTFDGHEVAIHFDPASGKQHLVPNSSQGPGSQSDVSLMFADFHQEIGRHASSPGMRSPSAHYSKHCAQDLVVTSKLSDIYQYRNGQTSSQKRCAPLLDCHAICPQVQQSSKRLTMEWPITDSDLEEAVSEQLQKEISIYDKRVIFEHFRRSLKTSTVSLLLTPYPITLELTDSKPLYFAAGLKPGDEVIIPVYTFHATCSSAMHFGITPVFCESLRDGTISPTATRWERISLPLPARLVTHFNEQEAAAKYAPTWCCHCRCPDPQDQGRGRVPRVGHPLRYGSHLFLSRAVARRAANRRLFSRTRSQEQR